MEIIALTPAPSISARGFKTVCFFDAQVTPDVRLYGLELVQTPDGKSLVYAPSKSGRRVATLSRQLADDLAALINGAGNDRHNAKAA